MQYVSGIGKLIAVLLFVACSSPKHRQHPNPASQPEAPEPFGLALTDLDRSSLEAAKQLLQRDHFPYVQYSRSNDDNTDLGRQKLAKALGGWDDVHTHVVPLKDKKTLESIHNAVFYPEPQPIYKATRDVLPSDPGLYETNTATIAVSLDPDASTLSVATVLNSSTGRFANAAELFAFQTELMPMKANPEIPAEHLVGSPQIAPFQTHYPKNVTEEDPSERKIGTLSTSLVSTNLNGSDEPRSFFFGIGRPQSGSTRFFTHCFIHIGDNQDFSIECERYKPPLLLPIRSNIPGTLTADFRYPQLPKSFRCLSPELVGDEPTTNTLMGTLILEENLCLSCHAKSLDATFDPIGTSLLCPEQLASTVADKHVTHGTPKQPRVMAKVLNDFLIDGTVPHDDETMRAHFGALMARICSRGAVTFDQKHYDPLDFYLRWSRNNGLDPIPLEDRVTSFCQTL